MDNEGTSENNLHPANEIGQLIDNESSSSSDVGAVNINLDADTSSLKKNKESLESKIQHVSSESNLKKNNLSSSVPEANVNLDINSRNSLDVSSVYISVDSNILSLKESVETESKTQSESSESNLNQNDLSSLVSQVDIDPDINYGNSVDRSAVNISSLKENIVIESIVHDEIFESNLLQKDLSSSLLQVNVNQEINSGSSLNARTVDIKSDIDISSLEENMDTESMVRSEISENNLEQKDLSSFLVPPVNDNIGINSGSDIDTKPVNMDTDISILKENMETESMLHTEISENKLKQNDLSSSPVPQANDNLEINSRTRLDVSTINMDTDISILKENLETESMVHHEISESDSKQKDISSFPVPQANNSTVVNSRSSLDLSTVNINLVIENSGSSFKQNEQSFSTVSQSNDTLFSQIGSVSIPGMDGTLGIKTMFSSTLSESLLDQSCPQTSSFINESIINADISMTDDDRNSKILSVDSHSGEQTLVSSTTSSNFPPKTTFSEIETINTESDNLCRDKADDSLSFEHEPSAIAGLNTSNQSNLERSSHGKVFESTIFVSNLCKSVNESSLGEASCVMHKSQSNTSELDASIGINNLFTTVNDSQLNLSLCNVSNCNSLDSSMGLNDLYRSVNVSNQSIHPCDKSMVPDAKNVSVPTTNEVHNMVNDSTLTCSDLNNITESYVDKSLSKVITPAKHSPRNHLSISSADSTLGLNHLYSPLPCDLSLNNLNTSEVSNSPNAIDTDDNFRTITEENETNFTERLDSICKSTFENEEDTVFDFSLKAMLDLSLNSPTMDEQDITESENPSVRHISLKTAEANCEDTISATTIKNDSDILSAGGVASHITENCNFEVNLNNSELLSTGVEHETTEAKEKTSAKKNTPSKESMFKNEVDLTCNNTKYILNDVDITNCVNTDTNIHGHCVTEIVKPSLKFVQNSDEMTLDNCNVLGGSEDMEETIIACVHAQERRASIPECTKINLSGIVSENDGTLLGNITNDGYYCGHGDASEMEITSLSTTPGRGSGNPFLKPSSPPKKIVDSNPEMTVLGEETIVMCESVVHGMDESLIEPEAVSFLKRSSFVKIPRYLMSPAPEGPLKKVKLSDKNETVQSSASLDETSMCALDYSLPLSDCTGMVSDASLLLDHENESDIKKDKDYSIASLNLSALRRSMTCSEDIDRPAGPEVPNDPNNDTSASFECSNNSGWMWDSYLVSDVNKSTFLDRSAKVANKNSDIRKLLSESINKSLSVKQEQLSPEEVASLKEHLSMLMDLLEKDNNEFESFRKLCEKEKSDMLARIKMLENQAIASSQDSDHLKIIENQKQNILSDLKNKEQELSDLTTKYNDSEEKVKQTERDLEVLKKLFLLAETDVPQLNTLLTNLKSLGVSTEGIMIEGLDRAINLNTLLNVLSTLLTKHNTFVEAHKELLKNCGEDKLKLENLDVLSTKYDLKEKELTTLKERCVKLEEALEQNRNEFSELHKEMLNFHDAKECKETYDAMTNKANDNLTSLQEQLTESEERFAEVVSKLGTIAKELDGANQKVGSLEKENNTLSENYEKIQEDLLKIQEIKVKYSFLENEHELLTGKYSNTETNFMEKIKQCEELSLINDNLQKEVQHLNVLLEENKKISEQDNMHLKEKYNILKSRFEEQSLLLDKNIAEIESFKEANTFIKNDLNVAKKALDFQNDYNIILKSEFKTLLHQFEEINEKYIILFSAKDCLTKNYEGALEQIKTLKKDYDHEVEMNKKNIEEISSLNVLLSEASLRFSDLQNKYDAISSENCSSNSHLASLTNEMEELKLKYTSAFSELNVLQENLIEKTEYNKQLEDKLCEASLKLSDLQNKWDIITSENESCNSHLNSLSAEIEEFKSKYTTASSQLNFVQENLIEKTEQNKQLEDKLCEASLKFSDLQSKYFILNSENESSNSHLASLTTQMEELKSKYTAAYSELNTLQDNLIGKSDHNKQLEDKVLTLSQNIQESEESLSKLRSEYDNIVLKYESELSKINQMESDHSTLERKYNETLKILEELKYFSSEKEKLNETNVILINSLVDEAKQLKEELSCKTKSFEELLPKYETEGLKVKSLEEELSQLLQKYQESCGLIAKLENDCLEKELVREKLDNEVSDLSLQVNELRENLNKLKCDYDVSTMNLENEHSKLVSLEKEHTDLVEKYKRVLSDLENLEADYLESVKNNEDKLLEVENLNSRLFKLNEDLTNLKNTHSNDMLDLESEKSKFNSLETEFTDLEQKYQEIISAKNILEVELIEKDTFKEKLLQDQTQLNQEIKNIQKSYDLLSNEYSELKLTFENENKELKNVSCEMKNNIDSLKKDLNTSKDKCEGLVQECHTLRTELSKLSEEKKLRENFEKISIELKTKCQELEGDLAAKVESELNIKSLQEKLALKNTSLESENAELIKKISDLSEKIIDFSSEVDKFKLVNSNLEKDLEQKHSEVNSAVLKVQNYKHYEELVETLLFNYNSTKEKLLKIDNNFSLPEKCQFDEFISFFECLHTEYTQLLTECSEKDDKLSKCFEEMSTLHGELQSTLQNATQLEHQLKSLNDSQALLQDQYMSILSAHDAVKEKCESLSEHCDALTCENRDLKELIDNLSIQLKEKESEKLKFNSLETEFTDLEQKYQEIISAKNILEVELIEKDTFKEKLLQDKKQLNQEIKNIQKSYDLLSNEYSELKLTFENETKELKNVSCEMKNNIDSLKKDLNTSKDKCEGLVQECHTLRTELSKLSEEKKLRENFEKISIELKTKCQELEGDLAAKIESELNIKSLQEKLALKNTSLESENAELIKKISDLSEKILDFSSEVDKFKLVNSNLEKDLEQKHSEVNSAVLKVQNYKHYEELVETLLFNYNSTKEKLLKIDNNFSLPEKCQFDEFISFFECLHTEYTQLLTECSEKDDKLSKCFEEMSTLHGELQSTLQNATQLEHQLKSLNDSQALLQDQYTSILSAHDAVKEKCESLSENCDALTCENRDLKELNDNLSKQVKEKGNKLEELLKVQANYESLVIENSCNLSKLSEKCQEYEKIKIELSKTEKGFNELKVRLQNYLQELESLKIDNLSLKEENNRILTLYSDVKEKSNKLEEENKKLKSDKVKYEKEYQTAIDTLRKSQDELCSVEKKCDEKMSRFTFILKEKEDFENKTLSLLKQNDELTSKYKELTTKVHDYEISYAKLLELESAYAILTEEKISLEKQLSDLNKFKRENTDLKASLAVKDSKLNEISNDIKKIKISCQQKMDENQIMFERLTSLMPGVGSFDDAIKGLEVKFKTMEDELQEEKIKCAGLDEECEVLNNDLAYKEKVMGDMYKQHNEELEAIKESLKKSEEMSKENVSENASLTEKVKALEEELTTLKTAKPSPCTTCIEMKQKLQKTKVDLADRKNKVSSLQEHLEEFQSAYKKKVVEYRKKIATLQDELGKTRGKKQSAGDEFAETGSQTDPEPLQLGSGQSGIVHSLRMKELEDKVHKMEKENQTLKKVCHNRLQTIKDLQSKSPAAESKKPVQRNVLSEVQNN